MIDHLGIQVADVDASVAFYTRFFAPLGLPEPMRYEVESGFAVGMSGPENKSDFWLISSASGEAPELHIAFAAADRAPVDAVHEAAIAAGVEVLHVPPVWPEHHPGATASSCATPTATTWRRRAPHLRRLSWWRR